MYRSIRPVVLAIVALMILVPLTPALSQAQTKAAAVKGQPSPVKKAHRVVIQVSQNDPALMTVALNNAENLGSYYREKGETVEIEIVAYGPGLHMVRSDTSPVQARLKAMSGTLKQVTFSGCGNTMNAQGKQENKEVTLVSEARIVPSGIARIADLQEQGWAYIRP